MTRCNHTETRPVGDDCAFAGPVTREHENPAAHGNITRTERCVLCGAERSVNINGIHEEYGEWDEPFDDED
ncbi:MULTISPECIES: hypothetical protein [Halomonas]|uniref:Uncharacterized protein n=1 Tax=Halomonas flagellata TaxID=2920385 RepID=A0ABS9RWZ4_9GAMM|nr:MULTISPECIES: hypothetical protein [Halomonas]MCH4564373.1 hypothetical protein [Halomonas flagellata]MDN3521935.1 hypothetical protein [Halomonas ramblicola]PXY00313.1 hypothetical protein CR157_06130 [Halomonas sp. LBP4]